MLDVEDDFPRSVALLRRADVLLVNPIRDGLNLVASEGALVNERAAVLALSPEAGAWERLGAAALRTPPFDVAGTAGVLHRGARPCPPTSGPTGPAASGPSPRPALPPTGSTTSSPPRHALESADRERSSVEERSSALGPVDEVVRPARGARPDTSGVRTATLTAATPRSARRSSASKAGRSPTSSPM